MYGRNSTNIFNRGISSNNNSSNSGGNIFSRNNNTSSNNNTNSYGNSNKNGYNSSNNNNGNKLKLGTNRVDNYIAMGSPRNLEDINPRWINSEMCPMSICIRPETFHLSLVELRLEDYFLIRTNKMDREQ